VLSNPPDANGLLGVGTLMLDYNNIALCRKNCSDLVIVDKSLVVVSGEKPCVQLSVNSSSVVRVHQHDSAAANRRRKSPQ